MTRVYTAPAGATSITINGQTYDVDSKGKLKCDDDSAHADLLSHGFIYGDAPTATAPTTYSADELARMKAALEEHAANLQADFNKRDAGLAEREKTLREVGESLNGREAELAARAADLGNRETALVLREAALAATTPPPPPAPPADTKSGKGK